MNRLQTVLAAAALSLATPALAAPPAPASQPAAQAQSTRPQWGLGVAIPGTAAAGYLGPIEVVVPLQVGPALRIEPSAGLLTQGDGDQSRKTVLLGIGVLVQRPAAAATDLYFGGRLKLGFESVSTDGPGGDDSGNDIVLAGVLGGEHWLAQRFSLGVEAQLGYYSAWDFGGDTSGLFTAAQLMARVYF